jgi:hypothetical protein
LQAPTTLDLTFPTMYLLNYYIFPIHHTYTPSTEDFITRSNMRTLHSDFRFAGQNPHLAWFCIPHHPPSQLSNFPGWPHLYYGPSCAYYLKAILGMSHLILPFEGKTTAPLDLQFAPSPLNYTQPPLCTSLHLSPTISYPRVILRAISLALSFGSSNL